MLRRSSSGAQELLEYLKTNYLADLSSIKFEGEAVKPPTQIPWFPSGLAWQLEQSKAQLRKVPDYRRLQGFLVHETNAVCILCSQPKTKDLIET